MVTVVSNHTSLSMVHSECMWCGEANICTFVNCVNLKMVS